HAAWFGGHDDIVAVLLERGAPMDGFRLAELGKTDELRAFIDADPSFATTFSAGGQTPLHSATYWGSFGTAKLLIERGADVRAQSRDGFLNIHPLGSAVATPDVPCSAQSEDNVLKLVDLLLDNGADVNAQRKDGMTALHTAAYRGHLRVIRHLIERGADQFIRSNDGGFHSNETPFDTAVKQKQNEAAALLQRLAT
ncbi:MAG: ankyrin repeat domain-containing protein, partial [Acidobacteriota bacterium]